jgi:flagellar hook protein FlgE
MDQSINGNGLFAIKRDDKILYTRAGDFQFNDKQILVNSVGDHVQGLSSGGKLADITLDPLARSVPKATSIIKFSGNLTTTVATPVVNASVTGVTVIDPAGGSHTVNVGFVDSGGGNYAVTITDGVAGGAILGTGTIKFSGGFPVAGSSDVLFSYTNASVPSFKVNLSFAENVTSLLTPTTLGMTTQDGYVAGVRTDQNIDSNGIVNVKYSNGQTVKGPRLAMAQFETTEDLEQVGGGAFAKTQNGQVRYGYAGAEAFGTLSAGHREGSNVDLAEEFSNLIVMQRGYQASSHVISTVNDMIQELFDMKGHR